ncbi:MAG: sigma-70 family RNA polymerase sigma factor [Actinobacteria bacterium]|nr:sigma-70 family RNA polymerase sigma factor [Actinomycetota bacterium]
MISLSRVEAPALSDEALVRCTRAGDLSCFEQLVERHRPVVLRVAARIAGPGDAEDLCQDVFLRAFHRLDQYRGDSPFRAWLLQIAHNVALNAATRRPPPAAPADDPAAEQTPAHARTPADELEVSERRQRLALKLRQVQPAHRAVLVLRDLEGLSYEEIAEITNAPLGSVKGRLFRARRELIEALRNNSYDWELPAA